MFLGQSFVHNPWYNKTSYAHSYLVFSCAMPHEEHGSTTAYHNYNLQSSNSDAKHQYHQQQRRKASTSGAATAPPTPIAAATYRRRRHHRRGFNPLPAPQRPSETPLLRASKPLALAAASRTPFPHPRRIPSFLASTPAVFCARFPNSSFQRPIPDFRFAVSDFRFPISDFGHSKVWFLQHRCRAIFIRGQGYLELAQPTR